MSQNQQVGHVYRKKSLQNTVKFRPIVKQSRNLQHSLIQGLAFSTENTEQAQEEDLLDIITDNSLPFDLLIDVLYKHFYEQGIHDFIVNSLYSLTDERIEFFICDFVFWVIIRGSEPLERFLIHRSSTSMSFFFLKIIQAMVKGNKEQQLIEQDLNDKIAKFDHSPTNSEAQDGKKSEFEDFTSFGKISNNRISNPYSFGRNSHRELIRLQGLQEDKKLRALYFEKVNTFITNLVDVSLTLKAMTKPERKKTLEESEIYNGISIPFARKYGEAFSSTLIVGLAKKQFLCFETRKRVPYRIVVETIDPQDLKRFKPRRMGENEEPAFSEKEALIFENPDKTPAVAQQEDPFDIKQNKYKDLTYLQDYMKQQNPDMEIEKGDICPYGQRKSARTSTESCENSGLRVSTTGRVLNFLQQNDRSSVSRNIKDQNITNFHRALKKKQSLVPNYDDFRVGKLVKKSQNQDKISIQNDVSQQQQLNNLECIEENIEPSHHGSDNKREEEGQNNQSENLQIQILNLEESSQTDNVKVNDDKINSIPFKFETQLSGERKELYEKNLKRFNILFKKVSYMRDQIKRRFSFSDTNYKQTIQRQKEFKQVMQEYNQLQQKKQKKIIKLSDLKIQDVLQFFYDLMQYYPKKKIFIDQIYKYLHYDLVELKIKELGAECTEQFKEFPRKFGPWGELWQDRIQLIKKESPYGHFPSYQARSIIIKGGDDLRQELICMQLIYKMDQYFKDANLDLWLRPYEIIVTSPSSGIIEFLPNTQSIDGLKKQMPGKNLAEIYRECFGDKKFEEEIQMNFIRSFAAYSIVSYLLQVKDRHNGNILIDNEGHMIHIDFGFIFSISPGNMNFESAPFKFTKEYGFLMDGLKSQPFQIYKNLVYQGLNELRKQENLNTLCNIINIMSEESDLPCYYNYDPNEFRSRFKENLPEDKFKYHVDQLINSSYDSIVTVTYDWFQKKTNGIFP